MSSILVAPLIALKEEMFSRTMKVATLCPREKVGWSPLPDALTLGQLLRHMHRSEHNRMRLFNGLIEPAMYYVLRHGDGEAKDLKATLGDVTDLETELKALQQAHRYTLQTIGGLSDEDLAQITDWGGKKRTALEFLFLMLEHEAHHRGQVVLYLRQLGVERRGGEDWRGLAYGQ